MLHSVSCCSLQPGGLGALAPLGRAGAGAGRGGSLRPGAATGRGHRALPAPRPVVSFVNSSSIFTVEIVRCYKSELWLVSLGSWLLFFFSYYTTTLSEKKN